MFKLYQYLMVHKIHGSVHVGGRVFQSHSGQADV